MKCLRILVIGLLAQCSLAQQPKVAVLPGSTFTRESQVNYDSVARTVLIQQKDLKVEFASGKTGYFRVFAILDRQDRLLWWTSFTGDSAPGPDEISDQTESFLENHIVRFAAGKIVVFWPSYAFALRILSSSQVCGSEQQCWDAIDSKLDEGLFRDTFQLGHDIIAIDLRSPFGDEFAIKKENRLSASPEMVLPKIESAERAGSEWMVHVQGPNSDRGIVVLNDKFAVIKASRVPKESAPVKARPSGVDKPER
jgi:hypothetical protein